jgi:hypothetical protein
MPSSRFLEKKDQDPRHCSTIITPHFPRRNGVWRKRGKWAPRTKLPGTAFIGTWAIGSEFADNFHRTDLLSMGDLRLTPEGNCF